MKRHWCVRRHTGARPDAIQRWDRAYQSILQWSLKAQHRPDPQRRQEVYHAGRAAYVRVSTPLQVKLQTIEQQLEMVRRYVKEKGWELSAENIFRDDGYSGATLKRPALDALRDRARLRELEVVEVVVAVSPDRLARNYYVHQMVLIEELEKQGCRVEFVERPMSTDPNDQLLLQILKER
jgi:DNA invertase Pin-like site-specific DNA recombinase